MMEEETVFYRIIDELCKEKNIEQKMLSFNWIRQLKKDNKIKNIIWYQLDLNSLNACKIAKDKYATYALLHQNNIPIIEHRMIFNPEIREDYYNEEQFNNAVELLYKYKKVIVKANQSAKGKHVFLCCSKDEIINTANELFKIENKENLSVCPYVDIDFEYRAVYLRGEILYIYKKQKPFVVGNGINTIGELISKKFDETTNLSFYSEIDFNKVLENNKKLEIAWKHNLCNGAEPIVIDSTDKYYYDVMEMAKKSAKAININFATIDIALTSTQKLEVVEINSSVCMDRFALLAPNGYEIAKEIYSKAIDAMFNY